MARRVISVSLNDEALYQTLMDFKAKGGNLSGLIVTLLKNYFTGKVENPTKELIEIAEIKSKIEEWEEEIVRIKSKIEALESKFKTEQEAKETEQNYSLLRLLEHEVFDDIEQLKQRMNKEDLKYAIEKRLSVFAANNKISLPEAWQLFFKVFPDLKKELEAKTQ